MIEFFTAPAPNGWKVAIMLEECGLRYEPRWVNLAQGDQHTEAFLQINPNGRIPAITDHAPGDGGDPVTVFESGAVLIYLAEKSGQFMPTDLRGRSAVHQWLFWQVGHLGPTLGQHGHFHLYAEEKLPYAIDRFHREALRVYGVMDRQLARAEFITGDDYTIADMACFPWVRTWKAQGIPLEEFPHVRRWYDALKQREGLRRGVSLGSELQRSGEMDAQTRKNLFGGGEARS
ncbi:glutathione S-transferase C-terminal domain-containing protein [Qipengyuania zhejiangensis]|uniref:glutathione S-transferase C-terminal domain-containing protein n=1 Tax=Qipengyuania zhejiangensis TaxID=3077782 RepID=UPI002D7A1F13|nr:glutathione S-transferase C-terminal domain-containing protein [Qipengyuania sp. Z2]